MFEEVETGQEVEMSENAIKDQDWWRGAVIYQIYPRSFNDTNGDGIGDLNGVTERMDYVASLGVDAIWLSPFFTSPMADFGYDVSNYVDVDPMFGSLADFDRMLAAAHDRGLKVIIDLVISHTSDQHPWFVESRSSKNNPKADWFVWADAKPDGNVPNNWLSIFGGPAWEWDSHRRQYYMHNFLASQPDLNFHNMDVQDAVLDVAKFWLDRGVDGFRLDTVNFYVHDKELRDNPPLSAHELPSTVDPSNPYGYQDHVYDKTRPENLIFLERLRALLDQYPGATSVGEIGADGQAVELTASYTEAGKRIHMAYSFDLLTPQHSAAYIRRIVEEMNDGIGSGWASWALSNHDVQRVGTRWGAGQDVARFAPFETALCASLRGTPCLYQGEELGLPQADVPFEKLQDPYGIRFWPDYKGRDGCRTPMPWVRDNGYAGFSEAEPWLPVAPEHLELAAFEQDKDDASILNRNRAFYAWRQKHAPLKKGDMHFLDSAGETLVFTRSYNDETILCAFNLGSAAATVEVGALDLENLDAPGFSGTFEGTKVALAGHDALFARVKS
ncbi:Oligo-1,6-glucosidase 1 [Labrenzia sp. THAF82]|uniref:alpha-glucosidase n=1 Tax=Labrenzia sp. THAF82 TaxID=2587861 RepID=UPI001267FAAC|nr:alpha-glucosidase [Labrenzia sp. THAF82]QFT33854.1 Oligo-1,6-glucosidase 1 [Labrenzia sp. THAF82]